MKPPTSIDALVQAYHFNPVPRDEDDHVLSFEKKLNNSYSDWVQISKDHAALMVHKHLIQIILLNKPTENGKKGLQVRSENSGPVDPKQSVTPQKEKKSFHRIKIQTKSDILSFCMNSSGQYLAVAEDTGMIHLYKASNGQVLFSYPIIPTISKDSIASVKFKKQSPTVEDLIVLTRNGMVLCLEQLDLPTAEAMIMKDPSNAPKQLMRRIQLRKSSIGSSNIAPNVTNQKLQPTVDSVRFPTGMFLTVANHGDYLLNLWRSDARTSTMTLKSHAMKCELNPGIYVKKLQFSSDKRFLIALTSDRRLSCWDWYDLVELFHASIETDINSFTILHASVEDEALCFHLALTLQQEVEVIRICGPGLGKGKVHVHSLWKSNIAPEEQQASASQNLTRRIVVDGSSYVGGTTSTKFFVVSSNMESFDISQYTIDQDFFHVTHQNNSSHSTASRENTPSKKRMKAFQLGMKNEQQLTQEISTTTPEDYGKMAMDIVDALSVAKIQDFMHEKENQKQWFQEQMEYCLNYLVSSSNRSVQDSENQSHQRVLYKLQDTIARLEKDCLNLNEITYKKQSLEIFLKECREKISCFSYRMTTFQLLQGGSQVFITRQNHFLQADLVQMMIFLVKNGSLHGVKTLWTRHAHLEKRLVQEIPKILRLHLPSCIPVDAYFDWLQLQVIPSLLHSHLLVEEIASWLLVKAKKEASSLNGAINTGAIDLQGALKLSGLLFHWIKENFSPNVQTFSMFSKQNFQYFTMSHSVNKQSFGSSASRLAHHRNSTTLTLSPAFIAASLDRLSGGQQENEKRMTTLQKLKQLHLQLQHINYLSTRHHFQISLDLFMDETPTTIALSMLDRISSEDQVKKEISTHVQPYLDLFQSSTTTSSTNISTDQILLEYVTELCESLKGQNSLEERKAIRIIECIEDLETRSDAAMGLFGSLQAPYSKQLQDFAAKASVEWKNSSKQEQIQQHVRLMEIQDMLLTYGIKIKQFNLADASDASRLLTHIVAQVDNKPQAFVRDALRLVDSYSHLQMERALVDYLENLFSLPPALDDNNTLAEMVSKRQELAMHAIREVTKRLEANTNDRKENDMVLNRIMDEVVSFGLMLIEMEEEELKPLTQTLLFQADDQQEQWKPCRSFVLNLLERMVTTWMENRSSSESHVVNETLMNELQRLRRIEEEFGVLLSVKTLREPEEQEGLIKKMLDQVHHGQQNNNLNKTDGSREDSSIRFNGKGKKRLASSSSDKECRPSKRSSTEGFFSCPQLDLTQRDACDSNVLAMLSCFASRIGVDPRVYSSLEALGAASNGNIQAAATFASDLFSLSHRKKQVKSEIEGRFNSSQVLKNLSLSISKYTASNIDHIFDDYNRSLQGNPTRTLRKGPMYSLQLLKYAICVCDPLKDPKGFEEILTLLKSATVVHEILRYTQSEVQKKEEDNAEWFHWRIYPRWFRGDLAVVLPNTETMNLATRFAIMEHRNLLSALSRTALTAQDMSSSLMPSKRLVSHLVDHHAYFLSLQILLTMRIMPDDAIEVTQAQIGNVLSSVFQASQIDNYLALGLMLSMEQCDAFDAFRRQISKENVVKDFFRFQQLAYIGSDAARAWQQIAFLHQCTELEGNARWWHYLNLLDIKCDHKAFQSDRRDLNYLRRLVPILLRKSHLDLYTVLEFTRHYQIEDSLAYLLYVEALLLPTSSNKDSSSSRTTTSSKEYQDQIVGVLDDIHESHLVRLLFKILPQLNGKDYDRLIFVFQLLNDRSKSMTGVKEREEEEEEVKKSLEILHLLTSLARFQQQKKQPVHTIDFHELVSNARQVLTPFLEKDKMSLLLGFCGPLDIVPDEMLMWFLKKQVQEIQSKDQCPIIQFDRFYSTLVKISSMKNQILVAEWLAEQLVLGEEKLKALAFALEAATIYEEKMTGSNSTMDTKVASVRLEKKILKVEIELLLVEHLTVVSGINGKENYQLDVETCSKLLTSLSSENKSFVMGLYDHFAQLFYHLQSGNLHLAMEAIGNKLEVSLSKLRLEMVQQWLVKNATEQSKTMQKKSQHVFDDVMSSSDNNSNYEVFIPLEEEQNAQIDQHYMEQILYMVSFVPKFPTEAQFQAFLHDMEDILSGLIKFAKETKPRAGATYRAKRRAVCVVQKIMMEILLYHQKYQHQKDQQEDEDDITRVRVYTCLLSRIEKEAAGSIGGQLHQQQSQQSQQSQGAPYMLNVDEKKLFTLVKALDFMSVQYQYLSIFEQLRLPHPPMNTWMQLKNKTSMIQSVFRECLSRTHTNSSERKKIIQLIGGLVIDFQVTHVDVWEKLMQQFQQNTQMERFLLSFLDILSESESIVNSLRQNLKLNQLVGQLWQQTLLSPWLQLKTLLTNDDPFAPQDTVGIMSEQQKEQQHSFVSFAFDTSSSTDWSLKKKDPISAAYALAIPRKTIEDFEVMNHMEKEDNAKKSVSSDDDDQQLLYLKNSRIKVTDIRLVLEQMLCLLEKCPFLDQLDIVSFVYEIHAVTSLLEQDKDKRDLLEALDLYTFAVRCAMMIPRRTARTEALLSIIQAGAYVPVMHQLQDTASMLFQRSEDQLEGLPEQYSDQLRLMQAIFAQAVKQNELEKLLHTPFENGMMEFLVATRNIEELLSILLKEKRLEVAANVVEMYYECFPGPTDDNCMDTTTKEESNWYQLQRFISESTSIHLETFRQNQQNQ